MGYYSDLESSLVFEFTGPRAQPSEEPSEAFIAEAKRLGVSITPVDKTQELKEIVVRAIEKSETSYYYAPSDLTYGVGGIELPTYYANLKAYDWVESSRILEKELRRNNVKVTGESIRYGEESPDFEKIVFTGNGIEVYKGEITWVKN